MKPTYRRQPIRSSPGNWRTPRALAAIVAPTVNSYKRLVPGYEAPVYIGWARQNRSALIRIPRYTEGRDKAVRAELRFPDPSCNPYLAFTVMLAAALDALIRSWKRPSRSTTSTSIIWMRRNARSGCEGIARFPRRSAR